MWGWIVRNEELASVKPSEFALFPYYTDDKIILTLPGMAGIVLTIGMAVDANVIIFERIREELRLGKGLRAALVDGYKNSKNRPNDH